jgi:hypothetical protein
MSLASRSWVRKWMSRISLPQQRSSSQPTSRRIRRIPTPHGIGSHRLAPRYIKDRRPCHACIIALPLIHPGDITVHPSGCEAVAEPDLEPMDGGKAEEGGSGGQKQDLAPVDPGRGDDTIIVDARSNQDRLFGMS